MTPNILQRGQASSPLFFAARGRRSPLSCPGNKPRGWSAAWRNHRSTLCGARAPFAKGARPAALHRGFRRGARLQARASWDAASAPVRCLRPVPAQRAPRSAVVLPHGRGPGAARCRGYEPQRRYDAGAARPCPLPRLWPRPLPFIAVSIARSSEDSSNGLRKISKRPSAALRRVGKAAGQQHRNIGISLLTGLRQREAVHRPGMTMSENNRSTSMPCCRWRSASAAFSARTTR